MTTEPQNRRKRILVVDDMLVNRVLLREVLKNLNFDLTMVENGRQALEELESSHYDIVLMDIEMPVMNGLEATRYIRTIFPPPLCDIPILALTAHNPALFFDDYKDVGFNEILTKPYSLERVKKLILRFI